MGSSRAKKTAKQADFQKPKLKVGKTRPKASNATDTSFKSTAIVLKDQHLSINVRSLDDQIDLHIAHLGSRSEAQRKEALAALINAATKAKIPAQLVLEKALPLITDGSPAVREQLLRLLQTLPPDQCRGFEGRVVLYLQTGLTHIASGVCRSALDLCKWASEVYGLALMSCSGGWYKVLNCFLLLLGWQPVSAASDSDKDWSGGGAAIEKLNKEPKLMVRVLETFASFLALGFSSPDAESENSNATFLGFRPHLVPPHPNPYTRLGLFEMPADIGDQLYEDAEARKSVFIAQFRGSIMRGCQIAKQQGGELGRAAGTLSKAIAVAEGNPNKLHA